MYSRLFLTFAFTAALGTSAYAQTCGSTNLVTDPPEFAWTNPGSYQTGTLVMTEATLDINGESLTTRVYAQEIDGVVQQLSIPGPTLTMEPGKKYVMQFKNLLEKEPLSEEHNVYKDPNVTNVHTHGLHISGESPGDDVTRAFDGQSGGDYVYDIPENHMGGTYWYHAHHHGSTFLQVSSGAFGLIIIDDANDNIPANVAAMDERQLLLGYLEPGNAAGTGGDTLISGTFSNGWTLNGKVNGDICIPPNTWQHWRMLVADQDARLVDLEIGAGCKVELMARDGVWRTEAPKALPDGTLTLTGASRADLAVSCNANSTVSVGGVQVANILVDQDATADTYPSPYGTTGTWSADRPEYLRDLRSEMDNIETQTIRMGARTILGRKFDHMVPNLIKESTPGLIQEWSINGATNHPFHLHIYHVQVQGDCGPYEDGEYYDVIAGNCDLRFDMSPEEAYQGMTIFHCHILQHEDQGAMAWMRVDGPARPPPTFPDGDFTEYYSFGGTDPTGPAAPTNLTATAVTSDQIDLSWTDKSDDEDWFAIERSLDGSSFSQIGTTVVPNVESFSDTGLDASTTYYYRVAAENNDGKSYSLTESATTDDEGGTPVSVEVAGITLDTVGVGRGQKAGQATIVVSDDLGQPVTGALVDGYFTGDFSGVVETADTADDDTVTVQSTTTVPNKVKNPAFGFCVTSITHETLAPFSSEVSGEVCNSL
jgi:FtsP/CotA-like multicopper oxidase with cupredoxin domain